MTDRSKFEQMLEHLINEDETKARELFHDIVVAKSREIYEELLAEDFTSEEEMPAEDPADMAAAEAGDMDSSDDMLKDIEAGDDEDDDMGMGDEEDGDGIDLSGSEVDELQDRVVDLEDALDALRDEFESLMGAEEGGEEDMGDDEMGMGDDEMGMDDGEVPEMGDMPAEMPAMEEMDEEDTDEQFIREYTEKVTAKMGDNGTNTKSPVAKANNMGGTTANIARGGESGKAGTQGGLLNPSTKEENAGNVNVPGGKAGVKHLKTVPAGHGAEKKGSKPDSEKSLLGR